MSGLRPMPGTEFHLEGNWYRVESYDNRRGCITVYDADGVLTTLAIDDLVHHPGLTLTEGKRQPRDLVAHLDNDRRAAALARIEHVCEAMTGYRSGDPNFALPHEPRPEYDPDRAPQKQRLALKQAELDNEFARQLGIAMSERTMRRLWASIQTGESLAVAAGRVGPRTTGRRIAAEVLDETERLMEDRRSDSTITVRNLYRELQARLIARLGADWTIMHLPTERTWRRYLDDRFTKGEQTGKARSRASAKDAPRGGFTRTNPTRPGQLVLMDTNNLDVLLKGTALEDVVRGSLVVALDAYSRSVCAVRVVEQTEKNIDVSFALLDVARPKQMLPGWPSEARWPFVGIPESVIASSGASLPNGASGMPFVNPEALVTDNGPTYRARKTRDLCLRHGIDLLPARAYSATDKAALERFFGAARSGLLERLKGYRGTDTSERGITVDGDAEWTAQRLEDLISLWVVLYWQTHIMDDVRPPWCPEGEWSPNSLYIHGLEASGLAPKVLTTDDYLAVLTSSQVKVHTRGVNIRGLWYDSPILDPYRGQPSREAHRKWKVHHDVRDLRHVWFTDPDGQRHRLPWVGMTGEFPAFSERHIHALRRRVNGDLRQHNSDELAEVLLTHILPTRDADGWVAGDKKAGAAASKQARDTALAAKDAGKFNTPTPPASAPAKDALNAKRAAKRKAATADSAPEAAPRMNTQSGGLFGDLGQLNSKQAQ